MSPKCRQTVFLRLANQVKDSVTLAICSNEVIDLNIELFGCLGTIVKKGSGYKISEVVGGAEQGQWTYLVGFHQDMLALGED